MNINYTTSDGSDSAYSKTLYVGNLDPNVSEEFILDLFSVIGACKNCKMIQSPSGTFCFVEYMEHSTALAALSAMNKRKVYGKEIVVNWATCMAAKKDTSNHHHIFVGDLAPETDSDDLKNYFLKIGEVSEARVMKDITTNKSKGYGFVSFVKYQDALDIVEKKRIIPDVLHGRQVRCNWATRKGTQQSVQKLDYNTVVNQSSPTNTTVYLGGCMSGLSDQLMRSTFSEYGNIQEVRVFPDKGFAFIRLDSHTDAARAITAKHGASLEGYTIKCSWGKEGAVNLSGGSGGGSGFTNGMSSGMDMNNWSPGTDVWSQQGQQQQQQYNTQWNAWRNPNQQQQQQQQNSWNAWGAPNQMNNSNGWMNNWGAWGSNNTTWGWPGQAQAGGDGGWGSNNMRPNGDQSQMWNNWNSQQAGMGGSQQTNADNSNSMGSSLGSGDPSTQQQQQQQQQQQGQPSNGFSL